MSEAPDNQDSTGSDETDADPTVTGADAVPDKTGDTPAKGSKFDESSGDSEDSDKSDAPGAGADTSIRDQD